MIPETEIPASDGLDVLNCNLGDLKLSFDPKNPVEADRAKRAVKDMLRRGYVIFIEVDGRLIRAVDFDDQRTEYLISDVPGESHHHDQPPQKETAASQPEIKSVGEEASPVGEGPPDPPTAGQPEKRGKGRRGIPAAGRKATAIAPRAGG